MHRNIHPSVHTPFPTPAETDRQTDRQCVRERGGQRVCVRERGGQRVCVWEREREREREVSPGLSTFIQKGCKMNYDVRLRSDWKVLLTTACFGRGLATWQLCCCYVPLHDISGRLGDFLLCHTIRHLHKMGEGRAGADRGKNDRHRQECQQRETDRHIDRDRDTEREGNDR